LKIQSPRLDLHHRSFGRRRTVGSPKWFDSLAFREILLPFHGVAFSPKSQSMEPLRTIHVQGQVYEDYHMFKILEFNSSWVGLCLIAKSSDS
jgi:hypothetical protein